MNCQCGAPLADSSVYCWDCRHRQLMDVQFESLRRARNPRPNVRRDAKREVEISLLNLWMALPSADWGERYEYRAGTL